MVELKNVKRIPKSAKIEILLIWPKQKDGIVKSLLDQHVIEGFDPKTSKYAYVQNPNRLYYFMDYNTPQYDQAADVARVVKKFRVDKVAFINGFNLVSDWVGFLLGLYDQRILKPGDEKHPLKTVYTCVRNKQILEKAETVACAVCMVRDTVNTPPDEAKPLYMVNSCKFISMIAGLKIHYYDCPETFGGVIAVGKGSNNKPTIVQLKYKDTECKNPLKIALVGKGVTYDSGGLSIKPTESMVKMKMDKAGACAILGVMQMLGMLKPKGIEVTATLAFVENVIGPDSYKPGDTVKMYNGTIVEITNTDAEGRLILADCMSVAQPRDDKPLVLIDVATLTGACAVGLGPYNIGGFTNSMEIRRNFNRDNFCGMERIVELPLDHRLSKTLKSDLVDMVNCPKGKYGGAITAALFLEKFVEKDVLWTHLDICGPAYADEDMGIYSKGATGAGTLAVYNLIMGLITDLRP